MAIENKPLSIPRSGLVGEWLLDGNSLDTNDGTKNNGTTTNVTYANTSVGYQKQAGVFNGSSSKVDTGFGGLKNNFSVSMVLTKGGFDGVAFSMHNAWCRIHSDGTVQASFYDGADRAISSSTGYVTDSNPHHLTWVKTSTNGQALWLDGVKVAENTSHNGTLSTYTGNPGIGYFRSFNAHYTSGTIQSVRIYDRALSPKEIQTLYLESKRMIGNYGNPDLFKDCVAYYDFKGDANDVVGGFNPTSVGSSVTVSNGRLGETGGSMNFPGTDANNRIILGNVLNMSGGFTVNAWIYVTDSSAAYQRIFGRISSNNSTSQFVLGKNGASIYAAVFNGSTQYYFDNLGTIPTNEWVLVGIKWTPSTLTGYVNGVNVGSISTSSSINSGSLDNAVIGGDAADGYTAGRFKGKISEIIVHSSPKSDDEQIAIYRASLPSKIYPFTKRLTGSLTQGLRAYIDGSVIGTTAYDQSGNGNNGTLDASQTVRRRFQSKPLVFTATDKTSFPNTNGIRAVSAWIYPTANNKTIVTLSSGKTASVNSSNVITSTLTNPTYYVNGKVGVSVPLNKWSHIIVTFDSENSSSGSFGSDSFVGEIGDMGILTSPVNLEQAQNLFYSTYLQ